MENNLQTHIFGTEMKIFIWSKKTGGINKDILDIPYIEPNLDESILTILTKASEFLNKLNSIVDSSIDALKSLIFKKKKAKKDANIIYKQGEFFKFNQMETLTEWENELADNSFAVRKMQKAYEEAFTNMMNYNEDVHNL